jgi:hypothetical protein
MPLVGGSLRIRLYCGISNYHICLHSHAQHHRCKQGSEIEQHGHGLERTWRLRLGEGRQNLRCTGVWGVLAGIHLNIVQTVLMDTVKLETG